MQINFNKESILEDATPAQKILWNYIYLKYGFNISITQLILMGIATTLEIYYNNPRTFYLAYDITHSYSSGTSSTVGGYVKYWDSDNVNIFYLTNSYPHWDTTAATIKYTAPSIFFHNILFNHFISSQYSYVYFIGFRINY